MIPSAKRSASSRRLRRRLRGLSLAFCIGLLLCPATEVVFPTDAQAVVGRPGTPRSAAGIARRTSRRTVRRHHRYDHRDYRRGAAVATGVAIGTRVATLPRGCTRVVTRGVRYHRCGTAYYRPYYQGTEVVYVVVEAP